MNSEIMKALITLLLTLSSALAIDVFHQEAIFELYEDINVKDAILSAKVIVEHAKIIRSKTTETTESESPFNSELKIAITDSVENRARAIIESLIGLLVPSQEFENLNLSEALVKVRSPPGRVKRGIPTLGRLWHDLSGAPGPDEYAREESSIKLIKDALNAQTTLDKSTQTEITQLKEKENETIELTKSIAKQLGSISLSFQLEKSLMTRAFYIIIFETKANFLLSSLESKTLFATLALSDARHGYLHPSLITVDKLEKQINMISATSKTLSPIIDAKNSHKYFLLPITKAAITTTKIRFIIAIPLVNFDHKMQITRVPYKAKITHDITPEFILSNPSLDFFVTANNNDMSSALKISNVGLLLRERFFEISLDPTSTPLETIKHSVLTRQSHTSFRYSFERNTTAKIVCEKMTSIKSLPKSGLLNIPENCMVSSNLFHIPAIDISQRHMHSLVIAPTFENLSNLESKSGYVNSLARSNIIKDIASLNTNSTKQLSKIRDIESKTKQIQTVTLTHDNNFMYIIYAAVFAVALFFMVMVILLIYKKKLNNISRAATELESKIELKEKLSAGEV